MDIKNIEPKSRKYMREYKRRQYAEKGDLISAKNKAYYYNRRYEKIWHSTTFSS